jgi:hypothetical protein
MVSDLASSSCRLPASDMLRTRSVRMRCLRCWEKMPTKVSQVGEALHALEFGAEDVGGVLEPDDQVGDVAFHHLLLLEHVFDAGVLDVEIGRPILASVLANLSRTAGLLDLGAHLLDDLFGLLDLGVEILQSGHQRSSRQVSRDCRNIGTPSLEGKTRTKSNASYVAGRLAGSKPNKILG